MPGMRGSPSRRACVLPGRRQPSTRLATRLPPYVCANSPKWPADDVPQASMPGLVPTVSGSPSGGALLLRDLSSSSGRRTPHIPSLTRSPVTSSQRTGMNRPRGPEEPSRHLRHPRRPVPAGLRRTSLLRPTRALSGQAQQARPTGNTQRPASTITPWTQDLQDFSAASSVLPSAPSALRHPRGSPGERQSNRRRSSLTRSWGKPAFR